MNPQRKWYSLRWKIPALFLLVAAAAGGGTGYTIEGRFRHPAGTGPAGPAVSAETFQRVWSREPVVLLGLGDSVTDGFGASPEHSYFDLLVKNDDAATPDMRGRDLSHVFPQLRAFNQAISGSVSAEHLQDQIPRIQTYPAPTRGVVVITSGGNDLIHDYGRSPARDGAMYGCTYAQALRWRENLRGRLSRIVEGAAGKFPAGCHVFLANIYDPTDGVGDIQRAHLMLPPWPDGLRVLDMANEVIADVCRAHPNTHLVDMHAGFLGHGIHCRDRRNPHYQANDPHYWYFQNLEDPNERGYDAIRRLFLLKMVEVLGPES